MAKRADQKTVRKKVACITGSSAGLGKMTAILLGEDEWSVVINSRTYDEKVNQILTKCQKKDIPVHYVAADVSQDDGAKHVVEETIQRFGRLDALIHAVGPFIRPRRLFIEHSVEEIKEMVYGNLLSGMWMARQALPVMREQQAGRIVFFGFGRAQEAPSWPDRSVYAAAKTGLVSLVKTLAVEEAAWGITVNMVCPGDVIGEKKEMRQQEVLHLKDHESPRGRPGSGEDVARVIQFLLQENTDLVTGNIINITGGLDVIYPVSKTQWVSDISL